MRACRYGCSPRHDGQHLRARREAAPLASGSPHIASNSLHSHPARPEGKSSTDAGRTAAIPWTECWRRGKRLAAAVAMAETPEAKREDSASIHRLVAEVRNASAYSHTASGKLRNPQQC